MEGQHWKPTSAWDAELNLPGSIRSASRKAHVPSGTLEPLQSAADGAQPSNRDFHEETTQHFPPGARLLGC